VRNASGPTGRAAARSQNLAVKYWTAASAPLESRVLVVWTASRHLSRLGIGSASKPRSDRKSEEARLKSGYSEGPASSQRSRAHVFRFSPTTERRAFRPAQPQLYLAPQGRARCPRRFPE
jgi:hypothetical protein